MLKNENLAANFCGLLTRQYNYQHTAIEWRILGQEQDGSMLSSWVSIEQHETSIERSHIGLFNPIEKSFRILHSFKQRENCIQATVNRSTTLLSFVLKTEANNETNASETTTQWVYTPYIVEIQSNAVEQSTHKPLLSTGSQQQIMTQFLWQKVAGIDTFKEDKLLLFVHNETISILKTEVRQRTVEDGGASNEYWTLDFEAISREVIVKHFIWAQWDPVVQALYYIHLKPTTKGLLEKDDNKATETIASFTTTLSAHQFNENSPRETVLNIPLNLPNIPLSSMAPVYEDDPIPLRIHDSSLNLIIVTDEMGMLFVCHYCIYQPIHLPVDDDLDSGIGDPTEKPMQSPHVASAAVQMATVHFSYSVTLLHHGCIIHCAIPGIPLEKAKYMKPIFTMHGDHHMLVYQPDIFCHMLDVGLSHEPCCHIVCAPKFNGHAEQQLNQLVPCLKWGPIAFDTGTLNLISTNVPKSHLIDAFKTDRSIDNRKSILHYFLIHTNDMDVLSELIAIIMEEVIGLDTVPLLREAFIAGTYASTIKCLPKDSLPLTKLLPLTSCNTKKPLQAKINNLSIGISHEALHNTTMMLLSPQQRLSPFRSDIWTKLWEQLNDNNKTKPRFTPDTVVEKLTYSLSLIAPETLSRCTTPMTPGPLSPGNLIDLASRRLNSNTVLPFLELETSTATKQEHIISVNLRELSVYLAKHTTKQSTGFRWLKDAHYVQTPSHVNTVASQYATAQLELSRALCVFVSRVAGVDARLAACRGYSLIESMLPAQQRKYFGVLERYYSAAESIAFPIPQGFASFFSYLGYYALDFKTFMQYVDRNVLELQMDVTCGIFKNLGSESRSAIARKHLILSKIPRSRSNRILKKMGDARALRAMGNDHANAILSGGNGSLTRRSSKGTVIGRSMEDDNFAPLDTFLDLLTAKANLNELDFNLLIEATMRSLDEL